MVLDKEARCTRKEVIFNKSYNHFVTPSVIICTLKTLALIWRGLKEAKERGSK